MKVTHGITVNGRVHGELNNPDLKPVEEVRRQVYMVDGARRFSLILWALPDSVPFYRVNHRTWPEEYIQTAGSPDRLMVEVRKIVGGVPKQFVVGRSNACDERRQVIEWDSMETLVRGNEVWTATEAGDLFVAYFETGSLPIDCCLRQRDV